MKGILVIIDGMGDRECNILDGKTPLESASIPNLNYLASHGILGQMHPVEKNVVPESDTAVLSILGNKKLIGYRGQFEALGSGIELKHGDLAFRTNFATIDNLNSRKIIDRRAGRTLTSKEASILAEAINRKIKLPCRFIFKNTIQHRGVLVLKGGFSDNITNTDGAYHSKSKAHVSDSFHYSEALDDDENSEYSAKILNEFIKQSYKILKEHKINQTRIKKGLMPANIILTRDGSIDIPKLNKFRKWCSVAYMPVEAGIVKKSGMKNFSFSYPKMKKHAVYKNLYKALNRACRFSIKTIRKQQKNFDYFYIHFKETDTAGHDNKPVEKKSMLEFLDRKFFSFLKTFAEKREIKIIVTADHSTPCILKNHSSDAVPVLFCNWQNFQEKNFSESEARKGSLGTICGRNLLKKTGFIR